MDGREQKKQPALPGCGGRGFRNGLPFPANSPRTLLHVPPGRFSALCRPSSGSLTTNPPRRSRPSNTAAISSTRFLP